MARRVRKLDQLSWSLQNSTNQLYVTSMGGHLAPVIFDQGSSQPIEPYFVNPWHAEELELDEPVLVPLRGDFFCLPFGENNAVDGEFHHVHGETAGEEWEFVDQTEEGGIATIELAMAVKERPGKVTKKLSFVEGQTALYQQHHIEGFVGRTTLGHHATLTGDKAWKISTSPLHFGRVNTDAPLMSNREYISLQPGGMVRGTRRSADRVERTRDQRLQPLSEPGRLRGHPPGFLPAAGRRTRVDLCGV